MDGADEKFEEKRIIFLPKNIEVTELKVMKDSASVYKAGLNPNNKDIITNYEKYTIL